MHSLAQRNLPIPYRLLAALLVLAGFAAAPWMLATLRAPAPLPATPDGPLAAMAVRTYGSTSQAVEDLQARLRAYPQDWQTYSQLGVAYLQLARETGDPALYPKAEAALQAALAQVPDDYTATAGMGALALARHQFGEALAWGERAKQINPDRTYAYGVIADAQIEVGRYLEAAETLQAMVNLRPDMSSYTRIAYIRELHGDTVGALDMMQRAVDGGSPGAENTAWARAQLATLHFNSGDLARAESEYRRTLADRPNYVYALAGLGQVRAAQGHMQEAVDLLVQAIQIMPLPEFAILLGDVHLAAGHSVAARQQYDLVHAIQRIHLAGGVDLDMEMALFDADHGRDPAATVDLARQALASRPGIHAADVLAWALYQAGDYREAQTFANQALRLGTRDARILFHAGMIAFRLGETTQARSYLEQTLAVNPHFHLVQVRVAREVLAELEARAAGDETTGAAANR